MELGTPLRTVVVEPLEDPVREAVSRDREPDADERKEECALPTTPDR